MLDYPSLSYALENREHIYDSHYKAPLAATSNYTVMSENIAACNSYFYFTDLYIYKTHMNVYTQIYIYRESNYDNRVVH